MRSNTDEGQGFEAMARRIDYPEADIKVGDPPARQISEIQKA
jgi:hypothetical protein